MGAKRVHRKLVQTAEEVKRIAKLRNKYQLEKPGPEDLERNDEYLGPIPHGMLLNLMQVFHALKEHRLKIGVSLTEIADRAKMDKAAVSRLENGLQLNPTFDTVGRYAAALGKTIRFQVADEKEVASK